jgi:hypothetical protein
MQIRFNYMQARIQHLELNPDPETESRFPPAQNATFYKEMCESASKFILKQNQQFLLVIPVGDPWHFSTTPDLYL